MFNGFRISRMLSAAVLGAALGALLLASAGWAHDRGDGSDHGDRAPARHVLLVSVDGLHQSDLEWWVQAHPDGSLARLVRRGVEYSDARTPVPSDSFPGMIAQVTGGDPATTGIYYDDSYNRALLAPGSACTPGQTSGLGSEVAYAENLALNPDSIDSGYGIPNLYPDLPGSVLALPGSVPTIDAQMIDGGQLPIDPATCTSVYPHQYLRVNTIFEVAHRAGMRTAWSDKHAAYELLAGPSGRGIDDLFTPEINSSTTDPSLPAGPGPDWTKNNQNTQFYDSIKLRAVLNEIDGLDHSGTSYRGVPAIFGMNFQSVSTAQKLPKSPLAGVAQPGGYVLQGGRWVPGPVLTDALAYVDASVGAMLAALADEHLLRTTTIVLSAKHGQSPIEATALRRIDDGNVIDALNAAWTVHGGTGTLVSFAIDDDAMYIWLSDRSSAARSFARSFLLGYSQPAAAHAATDYSGAWVGFSASGLAHVEDGPAYFGVPAADPRVPDLVGLVQHGVVYTGGKGKIAEHGGADQQDRHVPIVLYGAGVEHGDVVERPVETTQIAPTILTLLGLDPDLLQAVQAQHTPALPEG